MATHIVEQDDINHLLNDEFQESTGTVSGKNKRPCPGCQKDVKVERLGEHVRKLHPALWDGLFSVETLQESIDHKQLVKCTMAEGDHDTKFLICLACDSIRTTDRNHFQKNGKVHIDRHCEAATKMIAKKNGVAYVPKYKSDLDTALAMIDKLKRQRDICKKEHQDVALAITEKEDAQLQRMETEKQLAHDHQFMKANVKLIDTKNAALRDIAVSLQELSFKIPSTLADDKFVKAYGAIMHFAAQAAANH